MSWMLEGIHPKNSPSSTIMNNGWKHQGSFHDWIDKEISDADQEITLKGIGWGKGVGWGMGDGGLGLGCRLLRDYPDVKTIKH